MPMTVKDMGGGEEHLRRRSLSDAARQRTNDRIMKPGATDRTGRAAGFDWGALQRAEVFGCGGRQ